MIIKEENDEITIYFDNKMDIEKFGDPEITIKLPIKYNSITGYYVDKTKNKHSIKPYIDRENIDCSLTDVPSSTEEIVLNVK